MPTYIEAGITAPDKALACAITTWMLLLAVVDVTADDHAQPDILVFVADDAGRADFGACGRPTIRTPTILDLAGLEARAAMRGSSITPQISGRTNRGRKRVFSQRNSHKADEHMRRIRSERYMLIWNNSIHLPHGTAADITASMPWQDLRMARDKGELTPAQSQLFAVPRPRVEFYGLHADPAELNNLAANPAYRERIQSMMFELENWMRETDDVPPDRRRRDDNTDRITGVKFTTTNPPFLSESLEKAETQ